MAKAHNPSVVKLITGILFSNAEVLTKAKVKLTRKFGPIEYESKILAFTYTDYYQEEMGAHLKRQFIGFAKLICPGEIAKIKCFTNALEETLSKGSKGRVINLDPGYLTLAKLVLATCKNYSHRIYLEKGVFAEVTLQFQKGEFLTQPWTYPDYKTPEYLEALGVLREKYLAQLT